MAAALPLRIPVLLAMAVCAIAAAPESYQWDLPKGFPKPRVPADNPMSAAKVELGRDP
jgi:cytochrome c peroxidase